MDRLLNANEPSVYGVMLLGAIYFGVRWLDAKRVIRLIRLLIKLLKALLSK